MLSIANLLLRGITPVTVGCFCLGYVSAQGSAIDSSGENTTSLHERFWINAGLFRPHISTTLRLDYQDGSQLGTSINLEDDLGMEDSLSQGAAQAGLYLSNRLFVSLEYFQLNRRHTRTLEKDIQWGEEEFHVGATVGAFFDFELYRLAVGYDFFQNENSYFGVVLGAHMIDTAVGIGLKLDGVGQARIDTDASSGGFLPIPNIGLYYIYSPNARWRIVSRLDWFGLSIGEWDGELWSAGLTLRYYLTNNFFLGVGGEYFRIDVNYTRADWHGALELEYYGPFIQVGCRF